MSKITRNRMAVLLVTTTLLVLVLVGAGLGRAKDEDLADMVEIALAEIPGQSLNQALVEMARAEVFDKLERPPVVFDHILHTEALKEENCRVCHTPDENGNMTYEFFPNWEDPDKQSFQDAYHERCLECHDGKGRKSEKAKALGCGECHIDRPDHETLGWYPATFDHFHHMEAMEQGCDTCHHVYDEESKKVVYEKGKEIACGKCHTEQDEGNRASLRKVGHTGCIGCHEEQYLGARSKLDPYTCRNCHKPEERPRESQEKMFVMRSFQAHPTNILISYPDSILPPVPFDHEKHDPEKNCSKCCHHFHVRTLVGMDSHFEQTGDACRQCHLQGDVSQRAGCIRPDRIYHDDDSPNTCVGCHKNEKEKSQETNAPVTCRECHKGEVSSIQPVTPTTAADSSDSGPDTYSISRLSSNYLPVNFPHSMHSKMVGKCEPCHHHGPEGKNPSCNTCHGEPLNFAKLTRPRLVSAYHRMCMGCHRSMGIGPITCTQCHEERETIYSPGQRLQISEFTETTSP